ncbi:MAG: hypothetical protein WCG44_00290 [bacterium]
MNYKISIKIFVIAIFIIIGGYFISKKYFSPREYISQGSAGKINFPQLTLYHPASWTVTEDANIQKGADKIVFKKSNFTLTLDQSLLAGPGDCQFKDSPKSLAPSRDLTGAKYVELDSQFGHLRYFVIPTDSVTSNTTYGFCLRKEGTQNEYGTPSIGYISIEINGSDNAELFQEALTIIKNIKPI